jgi:hypothetical protein
VSIKNKQKQQNMKIKINAGKRAQLPNITSN